MPSLSIFAQPAGDIQINPYHKAYADSLKKTEYKPFFPIWGKQATKQGIDIPYPYGISPTYFYMKQEMSFADTKIGFNNGEMQDLTNLLAFGTIVNTTHILTVRPDVWILPFLNVYGVFGYGTSQVTVPIKKIANKAVDFSTTQHFGVSSLGFGLTLAGGLGPFFISLDNNMNWAKVSTLEKSVPAYNLDTRIGHCFVDPVHADRNVTVWVGAFMQTISAKTIGNIAMSEVIDASRAAELKEAIEESDLKPAVKKILEDGIDSLETSTVNYELNKKVAEPWNLIFGAQYQYNKHWQLRMEVGTFGKRTQFMLNLNYRFQ